MKYLDDVLILIGCALIVAGTYQVCPVATWFVGGGMCLVGGVVIGVGAGRAGTTKRAGTRPAPTGAQTSGEVSE